MTRDVSNLEDVLDVRDIIERFEELEDTYGELPEDFEPGEDFDHSEYEEFTGLKSLLEDMEGNSGDYQWRGSWYPVSLIRDSYFKDYAQEFAEDIGAISSDASWPLACIDWDQAASELQIDYTSVEFDGVTYWYR